MKNTTYVKYIPETKNEQKGDCVLRAISKLEENKTYDEILMEMRRSNPSQFISDKHSYQLPWIYEIFLKKNGYKKVQIGSRYESNNKLSTVNRLGKFCKKMEVDVLAVTSSHMVAITKNGEAHDSWNSLNTRPKTFWTKDEKLIKILEDISDILPGAKYNKNEYYIWFEMLPNGKIYPYYKSIQLKEIVK